MTILASSRAGWMGPSPEKCHQPSATLFSSIPATSLLPPSPALSLPPAAPSGSVPRSAPYHQHRQLRAGAACRHQGRTGTWSGGGCRQRRARSPCPPPCTPYRSQPRHCHPHHRLSHAGHQPPKATSPSAAEGTLRWGQCPERGRRRTWDRQHRGAGRRRQMPHGPGQASLATGRGRADHPSHPPYLGVLRPTVMDTIETPKIDRLHRLGAVSLTVRAGWGVGQGDGDSSLVGPSSPHCPGRPCPSPVLLAC